MATAILSPLPTTTRILRRSQARPLSPAPAELPAETVPMRAPQPPPATRSPVPPPEPVPRPAPVVANKVQVVDHPAAQHALSILRNKRTRSEDFRDACNQLLALLTLEATRSLPVREQTIDTISGAQSGRVLAKPVIFLSVDRDGLGLAHNVADFVPGVVVGAISLDPAGHGAGLEPRLHLASAPALGDTKVILFDPVVSTGLSAGAALSLVRRSGATDITLITFLISSQALCRVQAALPEPTVWTAAIDSDWDATRGPMPGFGSFAARLYD